MDREVAKTFSDSKVKRPSLLRRNRLSNNWNNKPQFQICSDLEGIDNRSIALIRNVEIHRAYSTRLLGTDTEITTTLHILKH